MIEAQVLSLVAVIVFIISVSAPTKKQILYLQAISNIFYSASYFLLNLPTTALMNGVSAVRCFVFYKYTKNNKQIPFIYLIIFILLVLILGIISYQGISSLIPITITIIYFISTYIKKEKYTRLALIICAIIWLIYNYNFSAYIAMIGNTFERITGFIALHKYNNKEMKNIESNCNYKKL